MAQVKRCQSHHMDLGGCKLSCGRSLGHTGKHRCGCQPGCKYIWPLVVKVKTKKVKK